jgi:hypothetical protein
MFRAAWQGALAGFVGTVAMTVVLRRVLPRLLPPTAHRGFLPVRVMEGLEKKVPLPRLRPRARRIVTLPAHYLYGMGAGAAYGLLAPRTARRQPGVAGAAWGLLVWGVSYQGFLPAAGIVPRTTDRPPRQWVVPLAAHVAYGLGTAYALEALRVSPGGADPDPRPRRSR